MYFYLTKVKSFTQETNFYSDITPEPINSSSK